MNFTAVDRKIMEGEGGLKANRMVAIRQTAKKNEALGMISTYPSK
jgi:hypothetical protein